MSSLTAVLSRLTDRSDLPPPFAIGTAATIGTHVLHQQVRR